MIVVFSGAAWWSVRVAQADLLEQRPDAASARQAAALTPASARAHFNAAERISAVNPLSDAEETELRTAVELNPRDSAAWMARGLKAEISGDNARAEQHLLEAARIDHTLRPAWTLANFYVRTDQPAKFWKWIRACLDLVEPKTQELWSVDARPMFALCWNVSQDAAEIQRQAVPANRFLLVQYLFFLEESNRLDAGISDAMLLGPLAETEDLPAFFGLIDRLLGQGRSREAIPVWNALISRKLLPYRPLDSAAGISLTNGDLEAKPVEHGFDWVFARAAGVYEIYSHTRRSLSFDLNGEEPENCELTAQTLPVVGGRRYRLHFRYSTSDISGTPGLHWAVFDMATQKSITEPVPLEARDQEKDVTLAFETGASMATARLALRYDRLPGTTRPKGVLTISDIKLELP